MLELGYQGGDIDIVRRHRRIVADLARESETPYVRVFALRGDALMYRMEQRPGDALTALNEALALVRSKVAVEMESELLADIAEAHCAAGQARSAFAFAQEAASLSRMRGNRLPLIRALAVSRAVVAAEPSFATEHGSHARLDREIETLVARTGARSVLDMQLELARGSSAA
jgi:adenylate cyclase